MLKYLSSTIVFQEVPDEISLALEITNCPHRCKNCHSVYLREDIGKELTSEELVKLVKDHPGISCICLMGGDNDHADVFRVVNDIHSLGLKAAMYSGDDKIDVDLSQVLDYYKIGSYKEEFGPLNKPTTNQRFYKRNSDGQLLDITAKFII